METRKFCHSQDIRARVTIFCMLINLCRSKKPAENEQNLPHRFGDSPPPHERQDHPVVS